MSAARSPNPRALRRALVLFSAVVALAAILPADAGVVVREKDANLDIALRVRERLRAAGVRVIMTRASDRTLTPGSRTGPANRRRVDAFVSIHNNASTSPRPSGTDVYRSLRRDGSRRLGAEIVKGFRAAFGPERRATLRTRRGSRGDYYYQLRNTSMPAVIVECAFVTNPQEGRRLGTSASFRRALADAIADGILRFQRTLVARKPPRLKPGTVVPAPLPPPTDVRATALGATRVALSWTADALVDTYRVYRDGRLLAVRRAPSDGGPMRMTDVWAAPGQAYRYEVRATHRLASGVYAESVALETVARTPAISIVLDPGHGGRDPGAVARY